MVWAVGKHMVRGRNLDWPDLLARSQSSMPPGFFSIGQLGDFMREAFASRGLANDFRQCPRTLLIPAIDLDRAERVVFGLGELIEVPISDAIAASCAIPGFFEPYRVNGRDYVDGDVGHTGHADLAVEIGATFLVVINPLVPLRRAVDAAPELRGRGLYGILEQTGRITSQNILELGLRELRLREPGVEFHLIQPGGADPALFGPSMGFEASRTALRLGYTSTRARLAEIGPSFAERFAP
jgi:predicted acylesterase/phospholipase RssA